MLLCQAAHWSGRDDHLRLRGDAWASLADLTKRMSDALTPEDQRPALRDEIIELVRMLDPLETYWAYPGLTHLEQSDAEL
jgi:arginine decarboxylase